MNTEKLSNENENEALNKHVVMQGLPTEEELWARLQELPYTKHLDDGQYNDGVIDGFEQGVRWVYSKLSGSPTVASSAVGSQTKCGGIEVCEDCPYKMHPCPEGCSKKV
jgi:hypothetical protein